MGNAMRNKGIVWISAAGLMMAIGGQLYAQTREEPAPQRETVAKPMTDREKKKREAKLKKELEGPYRKWLNEDVTYIITDEERAAFKRLATDEEKEQFIEQFWLRRDPTPDTQENEYKEEHYRRIAYSNERYASGIPGWKTDRGRIYITFGPPDQIESHPSGGTYERPWEEGGGTTSTYPFEQWRYRYIETIGSDIIIEFVDKSMTGEYRMTMDPSEKDALLYVPGAGLTQMEQMGMANKADRFTRTDGTHLGIGTNPTTAKMGEFERLNQYVLLQKPPPVKFKDLEAQVNSKIIYNLLPMQARADFFPATTSTVMTNITLQFDRKDLQFKQSEGVAKGVVNIYARITSMSRRVVNLFEDVVTVEVPSEMLAQATQGVSLYQKSVPLPPGLYRLNVVAKDIVGGNMNNYEMALNVPRMDEDKLFASSVILADLIEKVPTRSIGTGQFVIGSSKVRPRMNDTFRQDEKMGIYLKLYNFSPDEKTQKPSGTVDYEIVKASDNTQVLEFSEDVTSLEGSASQLTVEKLLPLQSLEPGRYTLKLKVTDKLSNQTLNQSASFTVGK
jgi:GWxTD domain-containing protein